MLKKWIINLITIDTNSIFRKTFKTNSDGCINVKIDIQNHFRWQQMCYDKF